MKDISVSSDITDITEHTPHPLHGFRNRELLSEILSKREEGSRSNMKNSFVCGSVVYGQNMYMCSLRSPAFKLSDLSFLQFLFAVPLPMSSSGQRMEEADCKLIDTC